MTRQARLAAIDIGTVTTRLLVADVSVASGVERIDEVERRTEITYLGQGLQATGYLAEEAIRRVTDVIAAFVERMSVLRVEGVSVVATSASRDAANGADFLERLRALGVEPRIVTGDGEAELAFLGTTYGREGAGMLVADLGGGSTELVLGDVAHDARRPVRTIVAAQSVDVGSNRVTEMFLASDPPTPAQLTEAREWCTRQFQPFFAGAPACRELIAVAGTATSLSAIHQGLSVYDPQRVHGSLLTAPVLSELLAQLASLTLAERREVIGLEPARAPVIVAGALVLDVLLGLSGLEQVVVSEHDLLYGILLDAYLDLR